MRFASVTPYWETYKMKYSLLLATVIFSIFGSFAKASESNSIQYNVIGYTWCNGPYTGKDGSGCPTFSSWKGVDLKRVIKVSLSYTNASQTIEIADSRGVSWKGSSQDCKSRPSDDRGCMLSADFSDPNKILFNISAWDFNSPALRISFMIENQNTISIFSPDNSYLVLDVKAGN